jgi:hypothetical protein
MIVKITSRSRSMLENVEDWLGGVDKKVWRREEA